MPCEVQVHTHMDFSLSPNVEVGMKNIGNNRNKASIVKELRSEIMSKAAKDALQKLGINAHENLRFYRSVVVNELKQKLKEKKHRKQSKRSSRSNT